MIGAIAFFQACILFAAHGASAGALSCNGPAAVQCSCQAMFDGIDIVEDGVIDPEPSPRDHASQCHDHCKCEGRASFLTFSADAETHPTPLPLARAQYDLGILIRPPR